MKFMVVAGAALGGCRSQYFVAGAVLCALLAMRFFTLRSVMVARSGKDVYTFVGKRSEL